MKLHLNSKLFNAAMVRTSEEMNIPEVYVEKDYWVCFALQVLFASELKGRIVFKGGTSLSKCYKIIDRFSEDIDIAFINSSISGNKKKKLLKDLSIILGEFLPEIEDDTLINKKGMLRKTVHSFIQNSAENEEINNSKIVLESSHLGNPEPFESKQIQTYVSEMMIENNQQELLEEYKLKPFDVSVQIIEKTFCEKIMSLVRFSYSEKPYVELSKKIRHIYDLKKMLENKTIQNYFGSNDFIKILNKVKNEDKVIYSHAYNKSIAEAIIFSDPQDTWNNIKHGYKSFKEMIIKNIPSEDEMLNTLVSISKRLKSLYN